MANSENETQPFAKIYEKCQKHRDCLRQYQISGSENGSLAKSYVYWPILLWTESHFLP